MSVDIDWGSLRGRVVRVRVLDHFGASDLDAVEVLEGLGRGEEAVSFLTYFGRVVGVSDKYVYLCSVEFSAPPGGEGMCRALFAFLRVAVVDVEVLGEG